MAMAILTGRVEGAREVTKILVDRLLPVLRTTPVDPTSNTKAAVAESPMGVMLHQLANQVEEITEELASLADRIAL